MPGSVSSRDGETSSCVSVSVASASGSKRSMAKDFCCRFCKRSIMSPNTYRKGKFANLATLPFKSSSKKSGEIADIAVLEAGGMDLALYYAHECVPCRNYLNLAGIDKSKDEIAAENDNPDNHKNYMVGLNTYEAKAAESLSGRVRREDVRAPVSVSVEDYTAVKATENMGVFWPDFLFQQRFKRKPGTDNKDVLYWLDGDNGQKRFGALVDEAVHGFPVGAVRLEKVRGTKASKSTDLANSSEDLRDGQTEDVWKKVRGRVGSALSVVPQKRKNDEEEVSVVLKVAQPPAKKQKTKAKEDGDDSSSESFDMLSHLPKPIVAVPAKVSKRGDGSDNKEKAPKAKATATSSRKRSADAGGSGGTPAKSRKATKQIRAITSMEQVKLETTQIITMASNSDVKAITEAGLTKCMKSLAAALSPENISLVTSSALASDSEEEAGEETQRGRSDKAMLLLAELKESKNKLHAVQDLIVSCNAIKGNESSAKHLQDCCRAFQLNGLAVANSTWSILLKRMIKEAIEQHNFAAVCDLLTVPPTPADGSSQSAVVDFDSINVGILGSSAQIAARQEKISIELLNSFLRSNGDDSPAKSHELVKKFCDVVGLPEVLLTEFRNLRTLFDAAFAMSSAAESPDKQTALPGQTVQVEIEEVKKAREFFVGKGSESKFTKAFQLFPVCLWLDQFITEAIKQDTIDRSCSDKLSSLTGLAKDIPQPLKLESSNKDEENGIKSFVSTTVAEGLFTLTQQASSAWLAQNEGEVASLKTRLTAFQSSVLNRRCFQWWQQAESVFTNIVDFLKADLGKKVPVWKHVCKAFEGAAGRNAVDSSNLKGRLLIDEDSQQQLESHFAARKAFGYTLKNLLSGVAVAGKVDIKIMHALGGQVKQILLASQNKSHERFADWFEGLEMSEIEGPMKSFNTLASRIAELATSEVRVLLQSRYTKLVLSLQTLPSSSNASSSAEFKPVLWKKADAVDADMLTTMHADHKDILHPFCQLFATEGQALKITIEGKSCDVPVAVLPGLHALQAVVNAAAAAESKHETLRDVESAASRMPAWWQAVMNLLDVAGSTAMLAAIASCEKLTAETVAMDVLQAGMKLYLDLLKKTSEAAEVKELDVAQHVESSSGPVDLTFLSAATKHKAAKQLKKTHDSLLVEQNTMPNLVKTLTSMDDGGKLSSIKEKINKQYEDWRQQEKIEDATAAVTRCLACLTVAQAVAKPLSDGETREQKLEQAAHAIKFLGGTAVLPPKVAMLLATKPAAAKEDVPKVAVAAKADAPNAD